jgi:hypothetical protein
MRFDPPRAVPLLLALSLALSACDRLGEQPASLADARPAAAEPPAARTISPAAAPQPASEAAPLRQRHVAVRHDLGVFTAADAVEGAWKAAETACLAAGCELLASSVARDDDRAPAAAFLDARLPPAALGPFLERLGGLGTIGRHATSAQDRTGEVVDVEARLKNMAEFRDNLRKLMATPGARLRDLIEVERELTRVQSELDSLATRRTVLANDTEKVRVSVSFAARPAVLEAGMWLPVKTALLRAGHVLASSLATLIGLAIALLPWLLLLFGAGLALRALLRRRRALAA